MKIVYLYTEIIIVTIEIIIVTIEFSVYVKAVTICCSYTEVFTHGASTTINIIYRYPARFDIVQAKFGIDLIRMKDIDKMKHHMETFFEASEKGKEQEMTFVGVQEQCEAHNWPEGGVQILNLGHNLFPKSEVCTIKIIVVKGM